MKKLFILSALLIAFSVSSQACDKQLRKGDEPKEEKPKKEGILKRELKAAGATITGVFVAIGTSALVTGVHKSIGQ
jgi:hypothetical protein